MQPADLTLAPATDPLQLYRSRDGIYAVDMLITGLVWMDFFSWLEAQPSTQEDICQAFEIAERPTDVMLTLFAAMGLIRKRSDGRFELTTLGREHLVKGSPWFIGPYYASLKERPVCQDLLKVFKTGKPANWGSVKESKDWHKAMEQEEFATQFTAAMDCRGVFLAKAVAEKVDFSKQHRLLDIAGGSGIYACSIAAHHPHLQATVLEKVPVDKISQGAIAKRGLTDRVNVVASDMLAEPLPTGFDTHLISNVLHDWDVPVVKQILQKSHDALPSGGLLIVHDMHLNAEKNGPLPVAQYSVILMHSTEGKCYSVAEINEYLGAIGFTDMTFALTAADRSVITARKR